MIQEIATRQSIRKYKDTPVTEAQLDEILRAAMRAPSARNEQCWRFVVIRNRKILKDISEFKAYMKMMATAPCCILVLADKTIVNKPEYMYYDCAAAIENMLLEAKHLDLGTCWCAIGPNVERIEEFRNYFNIEDNLEPISAVALGVSDEVKEIQDRFDPSKITFLD